MPRLSAAFPWIGKRPATRTDFYRFCKQEGVTVVVSESIASGIYAQFQGEHFIFLNSKLKPDMLRYVMFHELAHYLFHEPSQTKRGPRFCEEVITRNHIEAEIVTALLNTHGKTQSA